MQNTTSDFKRIEDLAKPEIEYEGYDHCRDHNQRGVPSFRCVIRIVKDNEGTNNVGQKGRWATAGKAPCKYCDPSYDDINTKS